MQKRHRVVSSNTKLDALQISGEVTFILKEYTRGGVNALVGCTDFFFHFAVELHTIFSFLGKRIRTTVGFSSLSES